MKAIIAIDPGSSGALTARDQDYKLLLNLGFATTPLSKVHDRLSDLICTHDCLALMENVRSWGKGDKFPEQIAKMMLQRGRVEGLLIASAVPIELVDAQVWQTFHGVYGLKSKFKREGMSDEKARTAAKNVIKEKAQELHPGLKITLGNADSLLICRYGWDKYEKLGFDFSNFVSGAS